MNPDLLPILIGAAVLLPILVLGLALLRRKKISPAAKAKILRTWAEIEADPHPAHAILSADKLLDFALGEAGCSGSLGDKLKKAGRRFRDQDAIWRAHKLRNRIAHEVGFMPGDGEVRAALRAFRAALRDLGV